jgi:hypothetical protein
VVFFSEVEISGLVVEDFQRMAAIEAMKETVQHSR